jgi:hypothetical protein
MRFDLPAGPGVPAAAISLGNEPSESADVDSFGNPAQSGFYESPTIDADAGPSGDGPAVPRRTIIAIKGTKEWGEWLATASKASGVPAAVLVEVALAEWASRHGFTAPPGR